MNNNINISKVIVGLTQRSRDSKTIAGYKCKIKRVGEILENNLHNLASIENYEDPFIRENNNNNGIAYYPDTNIRKLKLPMTRFIFDSIIGLLTTDTNLSKSAKKRKHDETTDHIANEDDDDDFNEEIIIIIIIIIITTMIHTTRQKEKQQSLLVVLLDTNRQ